MSDAPRQLPPKKEVALALLEGPSMFVHLDPRRAGVVVPKWLANQPQLVLQIGLNMAIPIPDLKVEEDGLTCTLSFNRAPFWCRLPWVAIYALVGEDGRGMVWPDDVPPEVALQAQNQKASGGAAAKAAKKGRKLAAVDANDDLGRRRGRADSDRGRARDDDLSDRAHAAVDAGRDAADAEPLGAPADAAPARKRRRELPPYLRIIK
jgi:stringent starvation protein B